MKPVHKYFFLIGYLFLCFSCFSDDVTYFNLGWTPNIWPPNKYREVSSFNIRMYQTVSNKTRNIRIGAIKDVLLSDVYFSIQERARMLSDYQVQSVNYGALKAPWYRGEHDFIEYAKKWIKESCVYFVDTSFADAESDPFTFEGWYAQTIATTDYYGIVTYTPITDPPPYITVTGLLVSIGAPTNWYDVAPYRNLDLPTNLFLVREAVRKMRVTAYSGTKTLVTNYYWYADTNGGYGFSEGVAVCPDSDPRDPAESGNFVDPFSVTPEILIDIIEWGVGKRFRNRKEEYHEVSEHISQAGGPYTATKYSRVFDYFNVGYQKYLSKGNIVIGEKPYHNEDTWENKNRLFDGYMTPLLSASAVVYIKNTPSIPSPKTNTYYHSTSIASYYFSYPACEVSGPAETFTHVFSYPDYSYFTKNLINSGIKTKAIGATNIFVSIDAIYDYPEPSDTFSASHSSYAEINQDDCSQYMCTKFYRQNDVSIKRQFNDLSSLIFDYYTALTTWDFQFK